MVKSIRRVFSWGLRLSSTLFYYLYPNKRKIVIKGFFKKYFCYIPCNNLGDELNFPVLKSITHKKVFSQNNLLASVPNILFIGSIIELYMDENSIIWGAGAIKGNKALQTKPLKVCSVRGPLTREYLISNNIACPDIYGDPALLLPLIYLPKAEKKKYQYGIIPHYVDLYSDNVKILTDSLDGNWKIIKFRGYSSWKETVDAINECEIIISSSLHGIIISDAYGIPNIWAEFSKNVVGDGFKFRDYFASVKRNVTQPLVINKDISNLSILNSIKMQKYERPYINMVPFLKNAPINIPISFVNKAISYYDFHI